MFVFWYYSLIWGGGGEILFYLLSRIVSVSFRFHMKSIFLSLWNLLCLGDSWHYWPENPFLVDPKEESIEILLWSWEWGRMKRDGRASRTKPHLLFFLTNVSSWILVISRTRTIWGYWSFLKGMKIWFLYLQTLISTLKSYLEFFAPMPVPPPPSLVIIN